MLHASIGVIGQGFVGKAVADAFKQHTSKCDIQLHTYDKYIGDRSSVATIEQLIATSKYLFVCVPTPANVDGTCDISIVESVIDDICRNATSNKIVIIKSTIPPGTTRQLATRVEHLDCSVCIDLVFNPEFLNARSAFEDFMNQTYIVLGGRESTCLEIAQLYKLLFPTVDSTIMGYDEAEMVKYTKNCFFATKVSFANEIYQICQKLNIDYTNMIEVCKLDDRVGWEHWKVPGPSHGAGPYENTTMFGFGGVCLTKDLLALTQLAIDVGVDPKVMMAAWEKNLEVRPERDWEYLPGATKKSTLTD